MQIKPQVEAEAKANENLVLLIIDVSSNKYDVLKQFKVEAIPHFFLYGPDGKELGNGGPDFFEEKIKNWKEKSKAFIKDEPKTDKGESKKDESKEKPKKLKVISEGEPIDLSKHLVKGKYTLLKFSASW